MSDTPETPAADGTAPAPKGIKKLIPMLAIVAGGMAVGAGTGAMFVGPAASKAMGYAVPADAAAHGDAPADDGHGAPVDDGHGGEALPTSDAPLLATIDNMVLNTAGSGGTRFLLVTVVVECENTSVMDLIKVRDAELRDMVLSMLARKSVDELTDPTLRDSIKAEVLESVRERLGAKNIVRVYFPTYVVQ